MRREGSVWGIVVMVLLCAGWVSAAPSDTDRRQRSLEAYEFGYHTGICDPPAAGMSDRDHLYGVLEQERAACERGVSDRNSGDVFDRGAAQKKAEEASR